MQNLVYLLCAVASLVCAALLLRAYVQQKSRLLLWSALGFTGFALNNVILVVDLMVIHGVDLSVWRTLPGLIGVSILVYGFVWDAS